MRAVDRAYSVVRDGILRGAYASGARLTEQDIALAAGVSRTPVREALRRLETEGLVRVSPNHGAVVAAFEHEDAEEIFDLRAVLEPISARRAAVRASAEQIAELRLLAERQLRESRTRRRGYLLRIGELNDRFHRLVQRAARSPKLEKALSGLIEALLILRTFREYSPSELQRSADQHLELVQALEARDPGWAASVMQTHIMAGRGAYLRSRRGVRASGRVGLEGPGQIVKGLIVNRGEYA
jgi:DNA-binding GntR family transcriptional regulator